MYKIKDIALRAYADKDEKHKDEIYIMLENFAEDYTNQLRRNEKERFTSEAELQHIFEIAYAAAFTAGYKTAQELR